MRDSAIIYRSFFESTKDLTKEAKADLWDAICELSLNFVEIELTGISKSLFTLIKPQILANIDRYENGKKGAEHGKKGGRPKKEKPQENPIGDISGNPTLTPNKNNNKNVHVNDNVRTSPTPSEGENEYANFAEEKNPPDIIRQLGDSSISRWKSVADRRQRYFTEEEWFAIEGYARQYKNFSEIQISRAIEMLQEWAAQGLSVSECMLTSGRILKKPTMVNIRDAKGNRIYEVKFIVDKRLRQIELERK